MDSFPIWIITGGCYGIGFVTKDMKGLLKLCFWEDDNGVIEFSLQKIQEMSCALLMQSGKVILCGIGFYRVHSSRGQGVLVHYG